MIRCALKVRFPVLAAVLILAALPSPARAQGKYYGRTGISVAEPNDAGDWWGTWYYVNRDMKLALWIRPGKEGPQLRLRYESTANPETFETDWNTRSTYYVSGREATFRMDFTRRDDKRIVGTWNWDLQFPDSGRTETGSFVMYRAGDGRNLVMRFDSLERIIRRYGKTKRFHAAPAYTFRKVSRRLVLWDELPF